MNSKIPFNVWDKKGLKGFIEEQVLKKKNDSIDQGVMILTWDFINVVIDVAYYFIMVF
jgi:hypothetical protein